MARWVKKIAGYILKPSAEHYLRKDRFTRFFGSPLYIRKGVFHPQLFYSTVTFWKYIRSQAIEGLSVLEVGTGSGALAISAAKRGARISACDINPDALDSTRKNALTNRVSVRLYLSDLFDNVPEQAFDRILVNPPFYPRDPQNVQEQAWYCGSEFGFFERFFSQARDYLAPGGEIWMVLSDDCNIPVILEKARQSGFLSRLVFIRRSWLERNFVYSFHL